MPWIRTRYVPAAVVLNEAVLVHEVPPVVHEVTLNDGALNPPVATPVNVTVSVLNPGQRFSAVAVITTVGGVDPFNPVTDELAAVIATQGAVPS